MDKELFNPQSSSVSSSRIIYTPSTFARTSLLHLQEVGSLQAIHPHTSQRSDLVSFLCFIVLFGKLDRDMDEKKHLEERLEYLEGYWEDLENDHERRERAIEWMKELPKGRDGVVQFLNGVTSDYCKAFVLSITVHSPLNYTVHWYDDTRTEVVMYSRIHWRCVSKPEIYKSFRKALK